MPPKRKEEPVCAPVVCKCGRVAPPNVVQMAKTQGKVLACTECKATIGVNEHETRGTVFLITFDRYYRNDSIRGVLQPAKSVAGGGRDHRPQWVRDALAAIRRVGERRDGFPLHEQHLLTFAYRLMKRAAKDETPPGEAGWLQRTAARLEEITTNVIVKIATLEKTADGVPVIDL